MIKKKAFDFSEFKYEPIRYQQCYESYEQVRTKLKEANHHKSQLSLNNKKLIGYLPKVFEHADKSCCGQIRSNGYYSFAKLIFRFFQFLNNQFETSKGEEKFRKDVEINGRISALLVRLGELQIMLIEKTNLEDENVLKELERELIEFPEFHRKLEMYKQIMVTKKEKLLTSNMINNNSIGSMNNSLANNNNLSFSAKESDQKFNSLPLFSPRLDITFESILEGVDQPKTKDKYLIYDNQYFMFWLDAGLVSFFKLYVFVLPFLRVRLYKYFNLIFSSKFRSKTLNKILSYSTVNFPFEFWNLSEFRISLLFVKYKTRNTRTKSREIYVPSQTSIQINESAFDKLSFNDVNRINFDRDLKIRCKYIKPKKFNLENCNKLIIHLHGGGFFSQNCDSHEIYLRYWVNYNLIPILTVDYKVKESFPNGLKDCLDVYLWLREAFEDEIRSKLGYYPEKIVITGDSAGGNLAIAVTLILNDLRTEYKSKFNVPIQMPDGLVLIYAPFLINSNVSPSRMLGSLDTLVPTAVQLIILYGISGLIPGLKPNTAFQALKTYLFPFQDPSPWFKCSPQELKGKIDFLNKFVSPQYLTTLFYQNFDTLTDVPLHLISAEFCSFLDESITLAKLWKGSVKVDVLENLSHGFLNLKFVGRNISNATMFCAHKITEIFEQSNSID